MKRPQGDTERAEEILAAFGVAEPTDLQISAAICLLNHLGRQLDAELPSELQSIHTRH